MKTFKLHFIRHGWTEANLKGIFYGSTDIPLCSDSIYELEDMYESWDYPYADWVFSSPLQRATETAKILYPNSDIVEIENLREISFGEFEGKTLEDAKGDELLARFAAGDPNAIPKGAEDPNDFMVRCRNAVISIINLMMTNKVYSAAIVTHMSVIGQILSSMAYPKAAPYEWKPNPGFGYTILVDPSIFLREPIFEVIETIPIGYTRNEYSGFSRWYEEDDFDDERYEE